jgi:hypothetical protein
MNRVCKYCGSSRDVSFNQCRQCEYIEKKKFYDNWKRVKEVPTSLERILLSIKKEIGI